MEAIHPGVAISILVGLWSAFGGWKLNFDPYGKSVRRLLSLKLNKVNDLWSHTRSWGTVSCFVSDRMCLRLMFMVHTHEKIITTLIFVGGVAVSASILLGTFINSLAGNNFAIAADVMNYLVLFAAPMILGGIIASFKQSHRVDRLKDEIIAMQVALPNDQT